MKMAKHFTDLIGGTPLLELTNLQTHFNYHAVIAAKLELFNPLSSAKDRVGYAMICDAEQSGLLQPGSVIIEPTSGNTGIGLSFVAASKGYRIILTMPETMSIERRGLLAALGAELVLTEGAKGMQGAIDRAEELATSIPHAFIPSQFTNPSNPKIHEQTTGVEIWQDTDGKVDIFVAGVGTGGTVTGVGRALKAKNPNVKIVAVEPADSPLLTTGKGGPHRIQGIGANFVPANFDRSVVDEIMTATTEEAFSAARILAAKEGVLCGISSGAALSAAMRLAAHPENQGKLIVVLLPDTGERYLSSGLFSTQQN